MARWYYPSVFDELVELRTFMEMVSNDLFRQGTTRLLPGPGMTSTRLLPAYPGEFPVTVAETETGLIVIALLPGVTREDLSATLVGPGVLEIRYGREHREPVEGYPPGERRSGSTTRVIALPRDVTGEGSAAVFSNGVLEIRLRTVLREERTTIPID